MTFRAAEGGNVVAARPAEMQTGMPSWSRSFAVTIVFLLLAVIFGCLAGSLGFLITESGIAADIQNWIAKIAQISREDRAIQASKPVVPAAPTATMRGIKHQLLGDVITITISLDKSVQYETHRLHDPERIVIDLRGARLDPKLHRIIEVNQGGLLVIRLSQFKPETARIVLDLARQSDYWINATADPPRLIINLSKRELEDEPLRRPMWRARYSRAGPSRNPHRLARASRRALLRQ